MPTSSGGTVFNEVDPSQLAIKVKIKEEHAIWLLAKLFRASAFSFSKPLLPTWRVVAVEVEELPHLVGSKIAILALLILLASLLHN
jgi:hypothetical protein